jgi:hypothetical protein
MNSLKRRKGPEDPSLELNSVSHEEGDEANIGDMAFTNYCVSRYAILAAILRQNPFLFPLLAGYRFRCWRLRYS